MGRGSFHAKVLVLFIKNGRLPLQLIEKEYGKNSLTCSLQLIKKSTIKQQRLSFMNKTNFCQILARPEEIPQKTSKNISRYFCSSFQGHA